MQRTVRSLVVLGFVLLLAAVSAPGQSRSDTDTMSVSVTVVRPCSVTTPAEAASLSPGPSDAPLRIRCGRSDASSPLRSRAILPVAGSPGAAVRTASHENGLVVSVDF